VLEVFVVEMGCEMKTKPLLKLLLEAGLGSRWRLADAIQQGRVQVNGEVVQKFSQLVDGGVDTIVLDGEVVSLTAGPVVYLMLNKPAGVLSTTRDDRGRKTVLDILPLKYHGLRLYPVGRLDKDSTGLLILTNDGGLTYQLTHPKFEHEKEYLISIRDKLRLGEEEEIEKGLQLDDGMTHPAVIKEVKAHRPFNYSITIHEGKKRQVRRMVEKLGQRVLALKRVREGGLRLGNLGDGQVRELRAEEVKSLLSDCSSHF
jgi:23S rRNA pseudouridine2605 synthase